MLTRESTQPSDADREALRSRPDRRPVMYQSWQELLFLHWEVPVEEVRRHLPGGLEPDLFEGRAYLGLVPFAMRNVRPRGLPCVPGISNFLETNVRTYVHRQGREPGVWFFSLDAAGFLGAMLGRYWFALPYFYARMGMSVETLPGSTSARRLRYQSRRLFPGPKGAASRVEAVVDSPVQPAAPGTLEYFLAERYLLYTQRPDGSFWTGRVHHTPYPLQQARLVDLDESLISAAGFERPASGPLAHYARGVDVEIFGLEPAPGLVSSPA